MDQHLIKTHAGARAHTHTQQNYQQINNKYQKQFGLKTFIGLRVKTTLSHS